MNQGRPFMHTHSPEEGECLNLWVLGLLESGTGGCRVLIGTEKSWARLPELATAKTDQQNWLGKQAGFLLLLFSFVCFFKSNSLLLLFFYYFFSFNTFFLSFLLSCSIPFFSPFISLLLSVLFFLKPHK